MFKKILVLTVLSLYVGNSNCAAAADEAVKKGFDLKDAREFIATDKKEVVEAFLEKYMSNLKTNRRSLLKMIMSLKKFLKLIDEKLKQREISSDASLNYILNEFRLKIINLIHYNEFIRDLWMVNDTNVLKDTFNKLKSCLENLQEPFEYKLNIIENFIKLFNRKIKKFAEQQVFIDHLDLRKNELVLFQDVLEICKNDLILMQSMMVVTHSQHDSDLKQNILKSF